MGTETKSKPLRHLTTIVSEAPRPSRRVPWQIWLVALMLGLEGFGNLLAIPNHPVEARWLAAKCLFITGLICGWRPVFFLFLPSAGLHVLAFSTYSPFVALLNLALVVLVVSAWRHFFSKDSDEPSAEFKPAPVRSFDAEFDA